MKNANIFPQNITGVWFRLDPYSDELYSKLRAELIVDGDTVESWFLNEQPHKEIKRFDEPAIVNANVDYLIRLTFIEPIDVPPDTNFWAGFVYDPETSSVEVGLHPHSVSI